MFPFRLSSIDMKYHVWKLGVVFTDNVSMASGKVKSYAPKSRDVIRCHKETSYGGGPGRCREFSWKTDSLRVWGDTSLSCNSIRPRGASLGNSWVSSQPKMRKSEFHECLKSCWISSTPQSFLYLAWYTTMSVLGHYNNFFFAAHLLDIAMGFKTLRTILSSVTHNGKQVWGLYWCRMGGTKIRIGKIITNNR